MPKLRPDWATNGKHSVEANAKHQRENAVHGRNWQNVEGRPIEWRHCCDGRHRTKCHKWKHSLRKQAAEAVEADEQMAIAMQNSVPLFQLEIK